MSYSGENGGDLTPHSVSIHLQVPDGERAAGGGAGGGALGQGGHVEARGLQRVPPHSDVVPASPNAVVPGLALGFHGLHSEAMTHCPTAQAVTALHLICYDPHLVQGPSRYFAHVVGDVVPRRALWVAGCEALSVPQVTVFIHCVNRRPSHGDLFELLAGW